MKYKTFIAAALTVTALTADVKAAACFCDTTFTGETCAKEYTKINPHYWACKTMIGTVWVLCKGTFCPGKSNALRAQQGQKVDDDCKKGGNEKQCEADLEKMLQGDVTSAQTEMASQFITDLNTVAAQVEAKAKTEADRQAKCYENTGNACAD